MFTMCQALFQALALYLLIFASKQPWDILQLSTFYRWKNWGRMMVSNSLEVWEVTDFISYCLTDLVKWLSGSWPAGGTWTRRPSGSQIKECFFPEKMLDQDIPRNMPMSSDLNICPHSMENSTTGTWMKDSHIKEKRSLEFP